MCRFPDRLRQAKVDSGMQANFLKQIRRGGLYFFSVYAYIKCARQGTPRKFTHDMSRDVRAARLREVDGLKGWKAEAEAKKKETAVTLDSFMVDNTGC